MEQISVSIFWSDIGNFSFLFIFYIKVQAAFNSEIESGALNEKGLGPRL